MAESSSPSKTKLQELAWESMKDRTTLTHDQFVTVSTTWNFAPLWADGKLVGSMVTIGPEIHACVVSGFGRWWNRHTFRDHIQPLIDKYGFAQTRATTDKGKQFVQRIGFKQEGDVWVLRR